MDDDLTKIPTGFKKRRANKLMRERGREAQDSEITTTFPFAPAVRTSPMIVHFSALN
jgi:hypothetical protein